ncbi:MAG: ribonuclease P protein component [SAR202 cluster bacterium]|nr:ribonuclease P protein component [SAR202 cluster bacterium]
MKRHVTLKKDFIAIARQGRIWHSHLLLLRTLERNGQQARFGLSVSKRVGKATVRNHVKRRLREILRDVSLNPGWDIVITARPVTATSRFSVLKDELLNLLATSGVVDPKGLGRTRYV